MVAVPVPAVTPAARCCRALRYLLLLSLLPIGLAGCQTLIPTPATVPPAAAQPPVATAPLPAIALPAGTTTKGGTRLINAEAVREFYRARHGAPAWQLTAHPELAEQLRAAIDDTAAEGLVPEEYHRQRLDNLAQTPVAEPGNEAVMESELLLTDAFLAIAAHYRHGRINLQPVLPEWQPTPRNENLGLVLEAALSSGTIRETLRQRLPTAPEYLALKAALAQLRQLAVQGGWPLLPSGIRMQMGDRGERIVLLRQRLASSGDLGADTAADERFDAPLQAAVQRFQARHGLKADGVVEQKTLKALNIPVQRRIQQLATNLERWRWLPRDLGYRHIVVNIAGFSLTVVEDRQPLLEMRVVAGRPDRPTPIFSSAIAHLVLNPTWEVPHEIATKDLLPKIRKDQAYLQRFGFRVLAGNGGNGQEVNPAQLDWQKLTPATFRYHLRQNPGADNFLGQVKFIFPNQYSVYLHDTPTKNLFQRESRAYSSGCVRLEKPLELAALLLHGTPLGSQEALTAALANGTKTVRLPSPMPIHLLYRTAWVDNQGTLHLRPDLYGHDRLIEEGLQGRAIKKPLPCIGECGQ